MLFLSEKGVEKMLLQFNMTNYMSFKNETILSLVANKDSEHKDYLISFEKEKILPSVSIYGANAAGKTNINKALVFCIMFVRNSNQMQVNQKIGVTPFLFDDESQFEKTRFDFIFINNGIKYEYGFVVDQDKVYEEYLYEYKTSKASLIFERSNTNVYRYTTITKKELSAIENKNTDNKLFLSTATLWNATSTRNAFLWFSEGIDVYDSTNLENSFISLMEKKDNDDIKTFMKKMLNNADINIVDYNFEIKEADFSKMQLPPGIQFDNALTEQLMNNLKEWKLSTTHKIVKDGEEKYYEFPFAFESKGTINYFYLGPILQDALRYGKTVVIDEIDSGLHPMLVRYLICLFNDKAENPKGAQLIFNTHDITQLSLNLFRRDQIYFVEKDNSTGISDLYSLDEYSPRKCENIQKGYMQGRYGAIPVIGADEIKW